MGTDGSGDAIEPRMAALRLALEHPGLLGDRPSPPGDPVAEELGAAPATAGGQRIRTEDLDVDCQRPPGLIAYAALALLQLAIRVGRFHYVRFAVTEEGVQP